MNKVWIFVLIILLHLVGCGAKVENDIIKKLPKLTSDDQELEFRKILDREYKTGAFKTAFLKFQEVAKQGNQNAQFFIGLMYIKGRGVKKDRDKGLALLHKLASKGFPQARALLAKELKKSKSGNADKWLKLTLGNAQRGDKRAWRELAKYYQKKGDAKKSFYYTWGLAQLFRDEEAANIVGKLFLMGSKGNEKNIQEGISWQTSFSATRPLELTSPQDQKILDFVVDQLKAEADDVKLPLLIFRDGIPFEKLASANNKKILYLTPQEIHFALTAMDNKQLKVIDALKTYIRSELMSLREKFIKEADGQALFNLAFCSFLRSRDIYPNWVQSIAICKDAANLGNLDAIERMGDILTNVESSHEEILDGVRYYMIAISKGRLHVSRKLANLFFRLAEDPSNRISDKALKHAEGLLQLAIQDGDDKAMYFLAEMYLKAPETPKRSEAITLLSRSAKAGNVSAMYLLAKIGLKEGIESQNWEKYIKLLESSAQKGNVDGIKLLLETADKDGTRYAETEVNDWVKRAGDDIPLEMFAFLTRHYCMVKKYKFAAKWSTHIVDNSRLSKRERVLYENTMKELGKRLPSEYWTVLMHKIIGLRQNKELSIRKLAIKNEIQTRLGLLSALVSHGLFENYNAFSDVSLYRPIYNELKKQAQYDPKICGYYLGALQDRSFSIFWNPQKALRAFEISAAAGNSHAMIRLGKRALLSKKMEKAETYFKNADELGNEEAQLYLGYMAEKRGQMGKAVNYFMTSAKLGNPWAELSLGFLYENGTGIEKSIYQATALYQMASAQQIAIYPFFKKARTIFDSNPKAEVSGPFTLKSNDPAIAMTEDLLLVSDFFEDVISGKNPRLELTCFIRDNIKKLRGSDKPAAIFLLGVASDRGYSVKVDKDLAIRLISQASIQKFPPAQFYLSELNVFSEDSSIDEFAAKIALLQSATRQGNIAALFRLAELVLSKMDLFTDKQLIAMTKSLKTEVAAGNSNAKFILAKFTTHGLKDVIKKNVEQGEELIKEAAEEGNAIAQFILGNSLLDELNDELALKYLHKSARQGNESAIVSLAEYYFWKDKEKSFFWFCLIKKSLSSYQETMRKDLVNSLSTAKQNLIVQRIGLWKPNKNTEEFNHLGLGINVFRFIKVHFPEL